MPAKPKLVTFDCAQTIVHVTWSVDTFIGDCLQHLDIHTTEQERKLYSRLYHERLPEYLQINLKKDPDLGAAFWSRLGEDWLAEIGKDSSILEPLTRTADELGFGPDSILFRLYDDVVPCFQRLQSLGIRLAVVSNWDYSLHRVIRMFGLEKYLSLAVASLEEGVEKPDPQLFHIALQRLGVDPIDALHVGDNPLDDLQGAVEAGMTAILIDRTGTDPAAIKSLSQLEEAAGWKN